MVDALQALHDAADASPLTVVATALLNLDRAFTR
jgi:hypothetical protein